MHDILGLMRASWRCNSHRVDMTPVDRGYIVHRVHPLKSEMAPSRASAKFNGRHSLRHRLEPPGIQIGSTTGQRQSRITFGGRSLSTLLAASSSLAARRGNCPVIARAHRRLDPHDFHNRAKYGATMNFWYDIFLDSTMLLNSPPPFSNPRRRRGPILDAES